MITLFYILCLLFLISIWASLTTYSFFWYENAWNYRLLSNHGRNFKIMTLHGILSSIMSVTVIMLTFPLGWIRRLWETKEISATDPVIILVHGLYHNPSAWLFFCRRLRKAGFKNIFIMRYGSFFTSFEKVIGKFEKYAAKARRFVPDQPVYLIGHSLGGLISRVYAERAQGTAVPAAVITMGSPHQGSKLAAFHFGKLAASLLYRGPLFEELEAGVDRLPCEGFALFSPVDNMVMPSEAMKVPYGGWTYIETKPMSHTWMLYSKSVFKKVIEVLQRDSIAQ